MRLYCLIFAFVVALTAPVFALSIPSTGELRFDVVRKGKDIGDHSYSFSGTENSFKVTVATNIVVRIPLIRTTVYSFQHDSVEIWQDGKLRFLNSKTNDDGESYELNIKGDSIPPASLWNSDLVISQELLNTIDGKVMKVRVADFGNDTVITRSGAVVAHHFKVFGDLMRDLWFDADSNLAQVTFKAPDCLAPNFSATNFGFL